MTPRFEVAGGTVAGRDHVLLGRNNQDALCWSETPAGLVAVVADGCGSGIHSEVGAQLGARLVTEILRGLGPRLADERPEAVLDRARLDLLAQLRVLANAMGGSLTQVVSDYLLFTLQGFVVGPHTTFVFGIGDGSVAVNGEICRLVAPDNAPAYAGYGLLGEAPAFTVHACLPTRDVRSLLVGTDGLDEVPHIAPFWDEDRYFTNPHNVTRRLRQLSRPSQGLTLPDDTTLVAARPARR
jgi:hypothetical protein